MNILVLDFETYYDRSFSLKKQTIPEYVADPRFHVHGLAIRLPDGNPTFRTDVACSLDDLRRRFGEHLERTTVVSHHAHFDGYILKHRFGLCPRYYIDTLLMANHVHGRRSTSGRSVSLSDLAERYGLGTKGDLDFMCGVRYPNERQLAQLASYANQDVNLTWGLCERLLAEMSRPEVEIPILMHTIRMFTERSIRVDVQGINELERQVIERMEGCLQRAGVTAEMVTKDKEFSGLLKDALGRTGRRLPMKMGKNGEIPATAKTDEEMQALVADHDPAVANLADARLAKKGADQSLARLGTLRRIVQATGGTLPPYLVYYGSHTGRFSGGGGFNIQNLPKGGLEGEIRNLLVPQPGQVFIIADLAQIEARITAWLAGEQVMLAAFQEGRDVYSEFASLTFGQNVRKANDNDSADLRLRLTSLREVGKQAVLGLGFGMGALKFMAQLRAKPLVAPLFDAGQLTALMCRQIVDSFRNTYRAIPLLWNSLEWALRRSIDSLPTDLGWLSIDQRGSVTRVFLPSGRAIRYEDLRLEPGERAVHYLGNDGMVHEFTPDEPSMVYGREDHLYGGKLCENIVQAIARDLLVEAILRLEARGLRVIFHVHDEVIVEVPATDAEAARQLVDAELSRQPEWAPGLPVKCEARVMERYAK